jgi:5-methylcytosine-specific restriction endonuclease McrA
MPTTSPSKSRNGGLWTEAKFRSFVVSTLRAGSRRWPVKWAVLKAALVGRSVNTKTGKFAQHYRCTHCRANFPATSVVVDHIHPVVDTMKGFTTWDEYIERMFVEAEGLQVLCKCCHKEKTAIERKERKNVQSEN